MSPTRDQPTTQACALTGNWTSNLLVHRLALNPLSYTSQTKNYLTFIWPVLSPQWDIELKTGTIPFTTMLSSKGTMQSRKLEMLHRWNLYIPWVLGSKMIQILSEVWLCIYFWVKKLKNFPHSEAEINFNYENHTHKKSVWQRSFINLTIWIF